MTTTLYLIRHGYTLWNEEGRIQGHLNSNLNETGKSQAVHLANRNHWHEVDALYSSDLQRALQTMSPIAKRIGLTITEDARLRERCMGVLEGITKAENQAKYPHAWTDYIARAPNTHPEGGETIEEVLGRALKAKQPLRRKRQKVET